MNLDDLENSLSVKMPALFHEIYQSGMMKYLLNSYSWIMKNSEKLSHENCFFGNRTGDCEFISFESILSAKKKLYEIIGHDSRVKEDYIIVPYAQNGKGDDYCFLYYLGYKNPKIILFEHKTGKIKFWAWNFEEFIFIQFAIALYEGEEEQNSDYTENHIKWLNTDHKERLVDKNINDLVKKMFDPKDITEMCIEKLTV